jgi:hypothetical protein
MLGGAVSGCLRITDFCTGIGVPHGRPHIAQVPEADSNAKEKASHVWPPEMALRMGQYKATIHPEPSRPNAEVARFPKGWSRDPQLPGNKSGWFRVNY